MKEDNQHLPNFREVEISEDSFEVFTQRQSRRGDNLCPKCRERERYGQQSYCNPCRAADTRRRRKENPEQTKRETEQKRLYRMRLKKGLVLHRGM